MIKKEVVLAVKFTVLFFNRKYRNKEIMLVENNNNVLWNTVKKESFSSASVSINPLLKKAKKYPFNFDECKDFNTAIKRKETTNIMVIQFSKISSLSNACMPYFV